MPLVILMSACGKSFEKFVKEYEPHYDSLRIKFRDIREAILNYEGDSSIVCKESFVFEKDSPGFNASFLMFQELFDPDIFSYDFYYNVNYTLRDQHFKKIRSFAELDFCDTSWVNLAFDESDIVDPIQYFGDYGYRRNVSEYDKNPETISKDFEDSFKKALKIKYLLVAKIDKQNPENEKGIDTLDVSCFFVSLESGKILCSFELPSSFLFHNKVYGKWETNTYMTYKSEYKRVSRYGGKHRTVKKVFSKTEYKYDGGDPKMNLHNSIREVFNTELHKKHGVKLSYP